VVAQHTVAVFFAEVAEVGDVGPAGCQPCGMCSGAIVRSGLGRVVYALSTEQWAQLNPGFEWPHVPSDGPALFDEARIPIDRYYQQQLPSGPGDEGD
jgi:deoxycytidylate deaminase